MQLGNSLNLPYSTKSLLRISNLLLRHVAFNIPFLADWNKVRDHWQCPDLNTKHKNYPHHDCDYKVGDEILLRNNGILCKSESW
jgi:hypothetical protein